MSHDSMRLSGTRKLSWTSRWRPSWVYLGRGVTLSVKRRLLTLAEIRGMLTERLKPIFYPSLAQHSLTGVQPGEDLCGC